MPENEFLSNQVGALLGVNVAEYGYWRLGNDHVFVTKDFVSTPGSTLTLVHLSRFMKGKWDCESVVKVLINHSSVPQIDLDQFVKVCLFDALIGNSDRHGKNLAFIRENGKLRLSPVYDNVSVMIAKDLQYEMIKHMNWGGKIKSRDSESPDFFDYLREFKRLKLGKYSKHFENRLLQKKSQLLALIKKSKLSAIKKYILCERIEEILPRLR